MSVVAEKIGDLNRTISYDDNCDKNFYLLQEDLGASITGIVKVMFIRGS